MNNTLVNLQSLTIYGDNNHVIGNKLVNTNMEIKSGDVTFPQLLLKDSRGRYRYKGGHPAARETIVAGNQVSGGIIRLGKKGTGGVTYPRTFPAENTVLAKNNGQVITEGGARVKGTKTLSTYSGTLGNPVQMKPSQVGPGAPDPLCEGGKPLPEIAIQDITWGETGDNEVVVTFEPVEPDADMQMDKRTLREDALTFFSLDSQRLTIHRHARSEVIPGGWIIYLDKPAPQTNIRMVAEPGWLDGAPAIDEMLERWVKEPELPVLEMEPGQQATCDRAAMQLGQVDDKYLIECGKGN